jgi:CMP-N-acetylneuraminic acid synthetase
MSVLGIIPARSGSKRLPGKHLAPLAGRPLIAHTCLAARHSGVFSALYVNTDCPQIAAVAAQHGVPCPVLRPPELARDETPTRDAILFLINALAARGETYATLVLLQPTSPLRTAMDIVAALRLYRERTPCRVVSVSPVAPRHWLGDVQPDGAWNRWTGMERAYRLNGALYIYRTADFVVEEPARPTLSYIMPLERSVDVDTPLDLEYAEFLLARPTRVGDGTDPAAAPRTNGAHA